MKRPWCFPAMAAVGSALVGLPAAAQQQPDAPAAPQRQSLPAPHVGTLSKSEPVTFLADKVEYDRLHAIVAATGHVEAWQNGQVLRADKVTFDRATGTMAAEGHVELIQPDGEVLFSTYAELTSDMKQGIMKQMSALLAENGKLVGNGARRTPGPINTLAKGLYTTCNVCAKHPNRPALWDLRARTIVQDVANKRIEYYNAWLDVLGVPVLYMPYFTNADPSVKRQSGFLVPSIGNETYLGTFFTVPYYLVLDNQSDATFVPTIGTHGAGQLETIYRRDFNFGTVNVDNGLGYVENAAQGFLFATGRFDYNDAIRYGFDVNIASSIDYLRDFNIGNLFGNTLNSDLYAEYFGDHSYAKISAQSYQGVNSTVTESLLPYVLPRLQYQYQSGPDILGGRVSVSSDDFNILRSIGVNDQRASASVAWDRNGIGAVGDVWSVTVRVDSEVYNAFDLNQQPDYAPVGTSQVARAQPTVAVKLAWPFARIAGEGSQIVEPIVQLVAAPNQGLNGYRRVPNEDSLDPEFSDATLFSLNRFEGIDRQEGGLRANVGLHVAWDGSLGNIDALAGESFREHPSDVVPAYVGLGRRASDVVARVTYAPGKLFDITARGRFDHDNFTTHEAEAVASFGPSWLRVHGGYFYANYTPFYLDYQPPVSNPDVPRREVSLGVDAKLGPWRVNGFARRNLQASQMVDSGATVSYENECTIVAFTFYRRETSINNDHGYTAATIQITLKTVGTFGFHAL